jgi:hypothetical protein
MRLLLPRRPYGFNGNRFPRWTTFSPWTNSTESADVAWPPREKRIVQKPSPNSVSDFCVNVASPGPYFMSEIKAFFHFDTDGLALIDQIRTTLEQSHKVAFLPGRAVESDAWADQREIWGSKVRKSVCIAIHYGFVPGRTTRHDRTLRVLLRLGKGGADREYENTELHQKVKSSHDKKRLSLDDFERDRRALTDRPYLIH